MIQKLVEKKLEIIVSGSAGLLSYVADRLDIAIIHELFSEYLLPVLAAVTSYYLIRFLKKYHRKKDKPDDNNEQFL